MFSVKFLAIGLIVAGVLALLQTVVLFTVGPQAGSRMCRPICAFYDFATGIFGIAVANAGLGLVFLATATALVVVGIRRWPRERKPNAVRQPSPRGRARRRRLLRDAP